MTSIVERAKSFPSGTVAVIGVPLDENSSFLRGSALGPTRIRETLKSGSANMTTELGVDLGTAKGWTDLGDMTLPAGPDAIAEIESTTSGLLSMGMRVLALGGDHSITYPLVRAYAKAHRGLTILHLDAHPDTYDNYANNRYSHASPFARIMEEGLGVKLIQAGIRTLNTHQKWQALRFNITMIEMKDWVPGRLPELRGPLYLSLDLDVLDPAFAPGVSHHEPGGMTARDVLSIIHALPGETVGADIVEFNPSRDPVGTTSMVAAKFYKEIVGRMLAPIPEAGQKP
jgi:arginase